MAEEVKEKIEEKVTHKKFSHATSKMRDNPWIISSIALGVVVLVLIITNFSGNLTGKTISANTAGENLVAYLNTISDTEITLVSTENVGSVYLVTVKYQGQEIPVYVTKDGSYYTTNLAPLSSSEEETEKTETTQTEVTKSDKPTVELFVMTYCPYGTQAEKGLLSVLNLLGDKIDGNIRFVHYFMHGEKEENETYTELCIREEQSSKYLDYLECFLEGDGVESNGYVANGKNSETCMKQVGVDVSAVKTCISSGKAKEYYAADSALSEGYGVTGSPTLVVNGVMVSSARDSASYLQTICSAFTTSPEECSETLSPDTPSVYFGWDYTTGSSTSASCS